MSGNHNFLMDMGGDLDQAYNVYNIDGKYFGIGNNKASDIREQPLMTNKYRNKYGKTQPELNDEEEIAKKARGQYIRDEQKRARQEELNKKKQELLNKAKEERIMRERYANRAKYTK